MFNFFAKRFGYLVLTMIAVSLLIFILNEYSPGQVARKILGPYAEENSVAILTEQMGLNRPVLVRYVEWLSHILRGDLGKSTLWGVDVSSIIWDRLGNTLIIASLAFAIIVPASIILGVAAGMREGSAPRPRHFARQHRHDLGAGIRLGRVSADDLRHLAGPASGHIAARCQRRLVDRFPARPAGFGHGAL